MEKTPEWLGPDSSIWRRLLFETSVERALFMIKKNGMKENTGKSRNLRVPPISCVSSFECSALSPKKRPPTPESGRQRDDIYFR